MDITIQTIKEKGWLLFECISGSRAYGTDLPNSDTDIKGVFVLPPSYYFGLHKIDQVSSEKNDEVYYELHRFAELLAKSNPGILEMLATPSDCILYCHPKFEVFLKVNFLSKQCKDTFAGFAIAQIKKARGLNKKINKPIPLERKTPLDFCYVAHEQGSMPLEQWLMKNNWDQANCGLVSIANMPGVYGLYYDATDSLGFSGIVRSDQANEVALSSIPKDLPRAALMTFNKDAYSIHCKEHREYREWEENRNEDRYQNTLDHGKNYDAKNMMHTIRLLDMAVEILDRGILQVRRPNREHLLAIRQGQFSFDALMEEANQKMEDIERAFQRSKLPDVPSVDIIEDLLVATRIGVYGMM
jgi:uncharacterized protein